MPLASFSLGLLLCWWRAEKLFWGCLSSGCSAEERLVSPENWVTIDLKENESL